MTPTFPTGDPQPLLMLTLPNSGSTWLANQIAAHTAWNRYFQEFFNPIRNLTHYDALAPFFGCELVECYRHIANPGGPGIDTAIELAWRSENLNFTKEVFSPFKLAAFARHFRCFVLLRDEADTFPPHRLRVWSFYEHAWWAMRNAGIPLPGRDPVSRSLAASRFMKASMESEANRLGVTVIHYRDLFDDVKMPALLAAALGECPEALAAGIVKTRTLVAR